MYNQSKKLNIQDKQTLLRSTSIIVLALVAGQMLFGVVTLIITKDNMQLSIPSFNDPLTIALFVMLAANLALSNFIYKSIVNKARSKTMNIDKFQLYTSAIIVRCALIEGVSLFAIVIAMLNINAFYLCIAAALAAYMFSLRPTADRIDTELDLGFGSPTSFDAKKGFN